jgi:hypothetical protein
VIEPRGRIRIESMDNTKITEMLESGFWPEEPARLARKVVLWIHIRIRRIRKFLGLPNPDQSFFVRILIRILVSSNKKSEKKLDFDFLWLLYDFTSYKTDVNVPSKVFRQRT